MNTILVKCNHCSVFHKIIIAKKYLCPPVFPILKRVPSQQSICGAVHTPWLVILASFAVYFSSKCRFLLQVHPHTGAEGEFHTNKSNQSWHLQIYHQRRMKEWIISLWEGKEADGQLQYMFPSAFGPTLHSSYYTFIDLNDIIETHIWLLCPVFRIFYRSLFYSLLH